MLTEDFVRLITTNENTAILELNFEQLDALAILLPASACEYDKLKKQLNGITQPEIDNLTDEFLEVYKTIVLTTVPTEANA
ncbi:hypothetical protein [Mucilaginibacter psychrotolerans]|uniref:Uncharacterized protein n=1 Tax=Mucilaginibacter psychrotolerans TaxID=1524096 RepID=A0A4Y8SC36_9SPHI|nr:hypothetical protein [Mucilaginibacter psychrotolerans]TFF36185.1 hypothetical protein E2R66_16725 [Mucilaginibacter psychrotolerans]